MKTKGYYDEGGFLDDGASVDPISGNDVPTGSLQEEVRDDIPAQLSEGEFVVPADVVRYIGLEKLMQMRDQAKSGLAQMEQEGQMGGSPAPMQPDMDDDDNQRLEMDALIEGLDGEDFEGAVKQFAEGGSVGSNIPSYEEYTGRKFGDAATVEYRKYTNDEGDIINVAFVRGKPVNPIPEGYYPVGSKPEEPPEDVTTPTGDGPAQNRPNPLIVQHRQLSSDKVTRQRNKIIDEISKGILDGDVDPRGEANGMIGYVSNTKIAEDKMLGVMLPDAINLYNGITTDPSFLDKILYKDKTNLEIMVMSTSSTQNARKARGELDPSYITLKEQGSTFMNTNGVKPEGVVISPEQAKQNQEAILGKTPSLKELVVGVVTGAIDLVKSGGIIGAVIDSLSGVSDDAEKFVSNVLETVSTEGVISPAVEEKIKAVESRNVIPANRRAVTPPQPTGAGSVPSNSQSPTSYDSAVPSTPAPLAQDVVDREDKLLKEMNGVPDTLLNTAGTEYAPEGTGVASITDVDPATPAVKPVVDSQLKMDLRDVANPVTSSAATTGIPPAYSQAQSELMTLLDAEDALSTGASLGTLGVTTELTPEETYNNNRAKVKKIAIANGFDVDLAIQAWENSGDTAVNIDTLFKPEDSISVREQAFINKNDIGFNDARDEAFNLIFANEAGLKKKLDPVAQAALTDEQRRQQSQTTTNSGGGDNKTDNNINDGAATYKKRQSDNRTKKEKEEDESDDLKMNAYAGGLASKKKQPIKKMRKDPTSGLAAKKKSKQKAKAKKGALAAKRT